MLTHDNLLSNAEALVETWRFTADDVLLHALPIFHTHGLFVASNVMLLAGGSMIFLPALDVDDLVASMPKATTMMGVPTFYTRLLADPRLDRSSSPISGCSSRAARRCLPRPIAEFEARTGHRILERYGMTETNMNTSNPYDGERRAGTVGLPLPGVELRIADPETGKRRSPTARSASSRCAGRNVFKGYWNMPEKTKEEFRADGFFITGDLGQVDADGYVTIVGRAKDLVISGGYNIYPKEVEMLLDGEPGVLESAVIGAPHPDLGEGVVAVVTPQAGRRARRGGAAGRHRRPPGPLQAAAPHRRRRRAAAQHDGQGAEECAARALQGRVQGLTLYRCQHIVPVGMMARELVGHEPAGRRDLQPAGRVRRRSAARPSPRRCRCRGRAPARRYGRR